MYSLRFDGLFRGIQVENEFPTQAGFLCYGWLVFKKDNLIAQGHGVFVRGCDASSNVAEYLALIEGLDALLDLGQQDAAVKIYGDAKSVIDQMRGAAGVSSESILPHFMRARQLAHQDDNLSWVWMPRRHNKAADWLTRRALRQIYNDPPSYQAAVKAITTHIGKHSRSSKLRPLIDLRIYQPAHTPGMVKGVFTPLPHLSL